MARHYDTPESEAERYRLDRERAAEVLAAAIDCGDIDALVVKIAFDTHDLDALIGAA